MTVFDTKQSNPHAGVGAYNQTIKNMQAFELPRTIEKQIIQILVACDISNVAYMGLTPTEQLTLSCLLTKLYEASKTHLFPVRSEVGVTKAVQAAYERENLNT